MELPEEVANENQEKQKELLTWQEKLLSDTMSMYVRLDVVC